MKKKFFGYTKKEIQIIIVSVLLIIPIFFSSILPFIKIILYSKADSNAFKVKVQVQGEYKDSAKFNALVRTYDNQTILSENASIEFTKISATTNFFSANIPLPQNMTGTNYTLLIKPDTGFSRAFCAVDKNGANCSSSNLQLSASTDLDLSYTPIYLGDVPVQDGVASAQDISLIRGNVGKTNNPATDINHDGITNTLDYSLALYSLSQDAKDENVSWLKSTTPTPEPTKTTTITPTAALASTPTPTATPPQPETQITKKVFVLVINPWLVSKNSNLIEYKNWKNPETMVSELINWFKQTTNGSVNYVRAGRFTPDYNIFPVKEDGFQYNETTYFECLNDSNKCHKPDISDYMAYFNKYNICSRFNSGEFDELWVVAPPWTGLYESRLTGTNAFFYNSPPLTNTTCNKLLPIMTFNPERSLKEMVHDYLHRMESTMTKVYGSWNIISPQTNWDKFAAVQSLSSAHEYSGCGHCHFTPTSNTSDYEYNNPQSVSSICDDFYNYPNLSPLNQVKKTITCQIWQCDELKYYQYWFQHLPHKSGVGPDGKSNDWLRYLIDPNFVLQ